MDHSIVWDDLRSFYRRLQELRLLRNFGQDWGGSQLWYSWHFAIFVFRIHLGSHSFIPQILSRCLPKVKSYLRYWG